MTLAQSRIENLLKQRIGLNPETMGTYGVEAAVKRRMAECQVTTPEEYLQRLEGSEQEMQALTEQVVVPETWFFRDRNPFLFLGQYVLTEWALSHPDRSLRILSVPCSTGEEPYSIAMALLDVGWPVGRFQIDAIDISQGVLTKATRAWYGQHSFRSGELSFRDRYFQPSASGYQLSERVRAQVKFQQGNLLSPLFGMVQQPYDAIFCRNLLIYLDTAAREKSIATLDRLLLPGGLLFVGHAEMGPLLQQRFTPIRHPLTFAYRKAKSDKKPTVQTVIEDAVRSLDSVQPPKPPEFSQKTVKPSPSQPALPHQLSLPAETTITLEQINQLADKGQLQEAVTLCHSYLKQHPLEAAAYRLLGVIHQALGSEVVAEQHWKQALYLNPNDEETLLLLLLLQERRGDTHSAEVLKQRLQRLADH